MSLWLTFSLYLKISVITYQIWWKKETNWYIFDYIFVDIFTVTINTLIKQSFDWAFVDQIKNLKIVPKLAEGRGRPTVLLRKIPRAVFSGMLEIFFGKNLLWQSKENICFQSKRYNGNITTEKIKCSCSFLFSESGHMTVNCVFVHIQQKIYRWKLFVSHAASRGVL